MFKSRFITKSLFALAFCMLVALQVSAGTGRVEKVFDGVSVNGTGSTVTSRVLRTESIQSFGYWFDATKAVTPEPFSLRFTIEGAPTTDGPFATMSTILASYADATYTAASTATAGTVDPTPATKYMRVVVEGTTTNATGTTVDGYIFARED